MEEVDGVLMGVFVAIWNFYNWLFTFFFWSSSRSGDFFVPEEDLGAGLLSPAEVLLFVVKLDVFTELCRRIILEGGF